MGPSADFLQVFDRGRALRFDPLTVAKKGFTEIDAAILKDVYGDADGSSQGFNLYYEYRIWLTGFGIPEQERIAEDISSPEQCAFKFLKAIDEEIGRLKKHQKARAAIESGRMKVEAVRRAVPESPALDRLLRYEVSLERSFDRTFTQLERLQRMRLGQPVPPRIDVNISSS